MEQGRAGAVRISIGSYAFFRPHHFDPYGPHTGPFFLWFPGKLLAGPYGSYDKYMSLAGWEVRIVKSCDRGDSFSLFGNRAFIAAGVFPIELLAYQVSTVCGANSEKHEVYK